MAIPTAFRPLGGSKKQPAFEGYTIFPQQDFSFEWRQLLSGQTMPPLDWDNLTLANIKTALTVSLGIITNANKYETANYGFNQQGVTQWDNQMYLAQVGSLPALALVGRSKVSQNSFFVAKVGRDTFPEGGWNSENVNKTLKVEISYTRDADTDPWIGVYGIYADQTDPATGEPLLAQLSNIKTGDLRKDGPVVLTIPLEGIPELLSGLMVLIREASAGKTIFVTRLRMWLE